MTLLDASVTKAEDGTWGFQCPGVQGDPCGDPPFSSTGWPTKKAATARGGQHFAEHKLGAEIREAVTAAERAAVAKALAAAERTTIAKAVAAVKDPTDETAVVIARAEAVAAVTAEAKAGVDRQSIAAAVAKESDHSVMQELHDFRVDQGLVVNDDGSVSVKDL